MAEMIQIDEVLQDVSIIFILVKLAAQIHKHVMIFTTIIIVGSDKRGFG